MKAVNIMWDIDDDFEGDPLPTEVEIPDEYATDPELLNDLDMLEETISDWLSDTYGMCHEGFILIGGKKK